MSQVPVEKFTARNPDYAQIIQQMFDAQQLTSLLGAHLSEIRPGFCEVRLPWRAEVTQNLGFFHGGAIAALADLAGGFSGWSLLEAGRGMLTVEYKVNLMAPGIGEELIARGQVIRAGRTLTVTEIDLFCLKDGKENHMATALQTLMSIDLSS